jgi:hypothetical protein
MKKAIVFGGVLAVIIILVCGFVWKEGIGNTMNDLERQGKQQLAKLETFHDKMWKTIKSQAKVTDKMKNAFQDIYVGIMEGRYSSGGNRDGSLMKWIHEQNPQFDQTAYTKLMTTIEAQRAGFFREQDVMQQIVKEYNRYIEDFPYKYFFGDEEKMEFEPISSSVSKNVMETGIDDELHLD